MPAHRPTQRQWLVAILSVVLLLLTSSVVTIDASKRNENAFTANAEYVRGYCQPTCAEDDFGQCFEALLSLGDYFSQWKHYDGAVQQVGHAIALANHHGVQDERLVLALLAIAKALQRGRRFDEADRALSYAAHLLAKADTGNGRSGRGGRLQAAVFSQQSAVLDCRNDATGALLAFERGQRLVADLDKAAAPVVVVGGGEGEVAAAVAATATAASIVSDNLKHIDLLWSVLTVPRSVVGGNGDAAGRSSIPAAVRASMNATLTDRVRFLQQSAGYPTSVPLQLPQNMIPNVTSRPVWGHSQEGSVVIMHPQNDDGDGGGDGGGAEDSGKDNEDDKHRAAVARQAQIVLDTLRSAHPRLREEFEALVNEGLLQEDDECVADRAVVSDGREDIRGKWFRYEPERPQFGQDVDAAGCSLATPELCKVVRLCCLLYTSPSPRDRG